MHLSSGHHKNFLNFHQKRPNVFVLSHQGVDVDLLVLHDVVVEIPKILLSSTRRPFKLVKHFTALNLRDLHLDGFLDGVDLPDDGLRPADVDVTLTDVVVDPQ